MTEEVIVTEVTTKTEVAAVVVDSSAAKKKKPRKKKSKSKSKGATEVVGVTAEEKKLVVDDEGNMIATDEKVTIEDGEVTKENHVVVRTNSGDLVQTDEKVTVAHGDGLEYVEKDVVVTALVEDAHGEEIAVEQHVQTTVVKNEETGDVLIMTTKEHEMENSDGERIQVVDETCVQMDSDGEAEVHHEKQVIVEDKEVGDFTKTTEVTDYEVHKDIRKHSISSSDIEILDQKTTVDVIHVEPVVSPKPVHKPVYQPKKAPIVAATSSASSDDTVVLLKRLQRKIRKREGQRKSSKPAQVKARGAQPAFTSSEDYDALRYKTHTHTYTYGEHEQHFGCF